MHYHFSADIQEDSKLLLGDMRGSVLILLFNSESRGPFKQVTGVDVIHHHYDSVIKVSI